MNSFIKYIALLCCVCFIAACSKHKFEHMEQNDAPFKKKVSIEEVKSLYRGETLTLSDALYTEGVVVGIESGIIYLQEKAGSAMKIYHASTAELAVGQLVRIYLGGKSLVKTGEVFAIEAVAEIEQKGPAMAIASQLTVADLKSRLSTYASTVVSISEVSINVLTENAGGKSFELSDATGSIKSFIPASAGYNLPDTAALLTGVVTVVGNEIYLNTRSEADIQEILVPPTLFEQIVTNSGLVKTVIYNTEVQLSPGVRQFQAQYINNADLITAFTMFEVDLKANASLEVGLANNGTSIIARHSLVNMATTKNTAIAASGWEVLGGISGDFWTTTPVAPQRTYEPFGPVIRAGVELKSTFYDNREFFGLTKDNKPVIGNKSLYDQVKGTLKEALGGRLILDKGELVNGPAAREPRPAIGYTADDKIYLFVGDGKQPAWSNGYNIEELAKIMKAIGVKDALYLSGGDYAMAAGKSQIDGTLNVISKPSWNIDAWMSSTWIITSKK